MGQFVEQSIENGLLLSQEFDVQVKRHQRRKKKNAREEARGTGLTVKEELRRIMKATVDKFQTEMDHRFKRLHDEDFKFGFLLNIEELCDGNENTNLHSKCIQLDKVYKSDFDGEHLYEEILHCTMKVFFQTSESQFKQC